MSPTDAELVDCAAACYTRTDPYFEDVDRSVRVFLTKRGNLTIIAFEGTHDPVGWSSDFLALGVEDQQGMEHKSLGFIHAGFYADALTSLTRCSLIAASGPYAICGHSLGAALALLVGALLSQDDFRGRPLTPVKIGAFSPPRVGGAKFVKAITSIPFCAYRYGCDIVPEIPFALPFLPYEQVPLIELKDTHNPPLDRFACHNIANYVAAIPR